ncbi:MAG: hypothetical protein HYX34_14940 [Actinobacteria bacterium]|nr:hypothetical protein [Actinomycetota bacterium]
MLLTRAPSRPPVVHATTESRVDPAPVPGEIRALALRLPADNPQRAFLADGMVTVEEREAAATAARDCSLAAARQLGLRASASRADQDGVAGYEFAISGDEARTTLWEARSDRCGDANEALVEAALSGGSAYDDAGVNQLEVDLVRNRVLAAA